MEKDFKLCSALLHQAWGTSVSSVRSSAAPPYRWLPTGLPRVVSEEGNLTFARVEGKFTAPAPFCHDRCGFLYGCFSDFFVGAATEERNIVGKHGHLHVFGYGSPKIVDVQLEEERRQGGSLRKSKQRVESD